MNQPNSQPPEEAIRIVVAHQTMLKAYIGLLIRKPDLVQETFSDVMLALFKNWPHYDPNRPFKQWARGVARRVAMANLRKHAYQPLLLADVVLEELADDVDQEAESVLELRKTALTDCMQRLPFQHRHLLDLRYFQNLSCREICRLVGRTQSTIYVVFGRMHKTLHACVQRKVTHQ